MLTNRWLGLTVCGLLGLGLVFNSCSKDDGNGEDVDNSYFELKEEGVLWKSEDISGITAVGSRTISLNAVKQRGSSSPRMTFTLYTDGSTGNFDTRDSARSEVDYYATNGTLYTARPNKGYLKVNITNKKDHFGQTLNEGRFEGVLYNFFDDNDSVRITEGRFMDDKIN